MNIIDIQDNLKDFSEQQLIKEIQMPSGMAPQFLVLSEINRRKRMRDDYAKSQAANQMTVAEEAIAAGGVPQAGIRGMSEAMAPQSSMAQSGIGTVMNQAMKPSPMPQREMSEAEVMGMAEGGVLRYQEGGLPLGLRLNNPGNIRPGAGFYGETGEGDGYARFGSEEEGLRAMARLLGTYGDQYGINTVEDLVSRYAPRSDNPESFDNYVSYMSDALGVEPDEAFDLIGRRDEVIPAMVGFEQGREYSTRYSPELVDRAITAASYDDPEAIKTAMSGDVEPDRTALDRIIGGIQYGAGELFGIKPALGATQDEQPGDEEEVGFFSKYILGPQGRELAGTETEADLEAKRIAGEAARTGEVQGERAARQYFYSKEYQDYLQNNMPYSDISKVTPENIPDGIMTPFEHMQSFTADPETGVSPMDRFTLGMAEDAVSAIEEGAAAARAGQTTEDIDAATQVERERLEADAGATQEDAQDEQQAGDSAVTALANLLNTRVSSEDTGIVKDIADLQAELKAGRETDKWLALAQAGMALMSSREPTLMGALGEAGLAGLGAQREADQRYREGVIDLINARAKLSESPIGKEKAAEIFVNVSELLGEIDEATGQPKIQDPEQRKQLEILALRMQGVLGTSGTMDVRQNTGE